MQSAQWELVYSFFAKNLPVLITTDSRVTQDLAEALHIDTSAYQNENKEVVPTRAARLFIGRDAISILAEAGVVFS